MIPSAMIHLLQNASPGAAPNPLIQFAPMVFIFVIFYFLVLAPMRKKQRATQEMLAKLKKGDEVITGGGIFGRIQALDEQRGFVVLLVADNVKIKVLRSAITALTNEPEKPASS
jgi:preprotein translocase subunit YajC